MMKGNHNCKNIGVEGTKTKGYIKNAKIKTVAGLISLSLLMDCT
jgi:hypothetical protein